MKKNLRKLIIGIVAGFLWGNDNLWSDAANWSVVT
tara:strand:- start:2203 stop:2307 length:105 start_codon:yes stop_codon:yes gene_type:complete